MFALAKDYLHHFRYLGVHDVESAPVQPSRVAWARRFCEDWQGAHNSVSLARSPSVLESAPRFFPESSLRVPTFTLRYPHSEATRTLGMTGEVRWPEFHAARAQADACSIERLLFTVDQDLAELEFGCCPVQSLSEMVLALEWLGKIAVSPEETRIWQAGAQILFQLSVAHGCDAHIDRAWTQRMTAHTIIDVGSGRLRGEASLYDEGCEEVDLPVCDAHVRVLKRVASELRSVMAGSYTDAPDVAEDVGVAVERLWHDLVASSSGTTIFPATLTVGAPIS